MLVLYISCFINNNKIILILSFSPAELFAVRSQQQSLPQRSHGQKDFLPDGSEAQDAKLQMCRTDQWELLEEERVERLGSLGRGIWKAEENLVELTLPAGKFWHTMGFTIEGRQYLLPEEALYLLECVSIMLTFSSCDYEHILSSFISPTDLGYVHPCNASFLIISSMQCLCSKILKITIKYCFGCSLKTGSETAINNGKEQVNLITASTCCPSEENAPSSKMPMHQSSQQGGDELDCQHSNSNVKSPCKSSPPAPKTSKAEVTFPASIRWDFSNICFPNCAPDQPQVKIPDPEPTLLPKNVSGRPADISCWLGKLNLRREKTSRREQEQWEWERKYKTSINADPKVKKCSNWKEYKELLLEKACQRDQDRPPCLWNDTVRPLLKPGPIKSTAAVLEEITVMSQTTMLEDSKRYVYECPWFTLTIITRCFCTSVYRVKAITKLHNTNTIHCLSVYSFDEQIPTLSTLKTLAYQSGDVPVVFALVDHGEVAFYTFKDFQPPVDVYP
ncbi:tRNA-splicing endonuclease subunit Sen54 [Pyxicephalus adspersus]|uniref:tRNA-splicing endonuclease subunit Sen54 n=1 Tax=Pyxicephalus adspersus TaxID=30357 RepID=UPI003B59D240